MRLMPIKEPIKEEVRLLRNGADYVLILALSTALVFCSARSEREHQEKEKNTAELMADLATASDYRTRSAAARQLGLSRDQGATERLITASFEDLDQGVRLSAVNALGEMRDARAVEPLILLLQDNHRRIRMAAARALGRLNDGRAAEPLVRALPDVVEEASPALASLGNLAVAALTAGLRDAETRALATQVLVNIGAPAIDLIIETLHKDENKEARWAAACALAEINDERAGNALNEALKTQDPELAAAAYRFLIRRGHPGTEDLLVQALNTRGRLRMAEDFLNCGNVALKTAAEQWGRKNGYALTRPPVNQAGLSWGRQAPRTQLALFHYDDSLASTSGIEAAQSKGTSFVPGKWGSALDIADDGILSYPVTGNLDLQTGTVEMWIAPKFDGRAAIYGQNYQKFILYALPNDDLFTIALNLDRIIYAGSVVSQKFAGVGGGNISTWKAEEWHHVAFTYSSVDRRQRLYVDGRLIQENREPMPTPGSGASSFMVISDPWRSSAFWLDELRISSDMKSAEAIQYDANRTIPFADDEVYVTERLF